MRPPLNAGENLPSPASQRPRIRRFNEAPAERGGKPPSCRDECCLACWRFNEAPAERGGKRPWRKFLPWRVRQLQ